MTVDIYEHLHKRIAELEAANAICRSDIEALMRSADSLEARNTELESALSATIQGIPIVKAEMKARIVELDAALGQMIPPESDMETTAEERDDAHIGSANQQFSSRLLRDHDRALARIAELEAERDRLLKASVNVVKGYRNFQIIDHQLATLAIEVDAALSDPSGE